MTDRLIPMTDDRARLLVAGDDCDEPLPGSIVLTNGPHGTAWQRYFSDGLWHRVGGNATRHWQALMRERNVVLVYDAPEREEGEYR